MEKRVINSSLLQGVACNVLVQITRASCFDLQVLAHTGLEIFLACFGDVGINMLLC